ncbi:hypothetical protein V6N12_050406 [Hibiscus sabdariffa]|uniref:Uncharacterized protein n=1 Tax=Hibiscus sabdariffa TaxID=183260 RepID=A0ABR2GCA4_9ROSI
MNWRLESGGWSDHGKVVSKAKASVVGFQVGKVGKEYKSNGTPARSKMKHHEPGALVITDKVQTILNGIDELLSSKGGVEVTGVRGMEEDDPGTIVLKGFLMVWVWRRTIWGATRPSFRRHLRNFIRYSSARIAILMETRISGRGADTVVKRLGFDYSFRVEAH